MKTLDVPRLGAMLAAGEHEQLRALGLSKFEIRTFVLPIVREHLGEIPPATVKGLTSNWAGKSLMSRNAV